MKNKYLIAGISSLAVLAAAAGITTQALAAPIASRVANQSIVARAKHPVLTAAQIATRKAEVTAVQTALTDGDYNAWVTAVKTENPKSPLLTKITATNFSQYTQAISLEKQAESIFKTLGVNGGDGGFISKHIKPLGTNFGWHRGQVKPITK